MVNPRYLQERSKSQLAIETTYRFRRAAPETYVFWLHTSSATRLEQSIRKTLEELHVSEIKDSSANIFQLFRAWLLDKKQPRYWLVVLDNADDTSFLLQTPDVAAQNDDRGQQAVSLERRLDYLPFCEHGTLLVTSRSRAAALKIVQPNDIINVLPMDEAQACALLEKKLDGHIEYSREELNELVSELGSMPLALAQAAAYISESIPKLSMGDYLSKLTSSEGSRARLLDQSAVDLRRDGHAENRMRRTWEISFEYIRELRSSAADLLAFMSFFDRHAIPLTLLQAQYTAQMGTRRRKSTTQSYSRSSFVSNFSERIKSGARLYKGRRKLKTPLKMIHPPLGVGNTALANSASDDLIDTLNDDLRILRNYSLITTMADPTTFEMHHLVQFAMQDWMTLNGSLQHWFSEFMTILEGVFADPVEDQKTRRLILPHVVATMGAEQQDRNVDLRRASLLVKAALHATSLQEYTVAHKLYERALDCRKTLLGPDHPDTIRSELYLGVSCFRIGQYENARSIQTGVLGRSQRVLGEDHSSTLKLRADTAVTYRALGLLADAEKMQVQVLFRTRISYGRVHLRSARIMQDLAITLTEQGRYDETGKLLKDTLSIAKELNTEEPAFPPSVLRTLASTYNQAGRYAEAVQLFNEVWQDCIRMFGDDHPLTLWRMCDLSTAMYRSGRRGSALELMRSCADRMAQKCGPDHADTIEQYELLRSWEAEEEPQQDSEEVLLTPATSRSRAPLENGSILWVAGTVAVFFAAAWFFIFERSERLGERKA